MQENQGTTVISGSCTVARICCTVMTTGMGGRMEAAAAALVCLLVFQVAVLPSAAFYLPGVAPMDYKKVRT